MTDPASPEDSAGSPAFTPSGAKAGRVLIFDTTLRDGEQSPGASMNLDEKLRIAGILDELGVDVIEAGFPAASQGDFDCVRQIAEIAGRATICGLARARAADIDRAWAALQPAPRARIHTFISTSPLHMEHKLQMTPEAVLEAIESSVGHARRLTSDVEWSAEDAARSDPDFLCRAVETAIRAGATTINIPDTVGYALPEEFGALIAELRGRVPDSDRAVFSVHCHNDLGLAVANSLAGIAAGARQVECTINGIGERAGNAALEEIVMALKTRRGELGVDSGIDTTLITRASRLVSTVTGFPVQPNKAVVGANAFAHESGIHQHGMLCHAGTYEIMTPESVGLARSNLVLGKHSGRHAFREKLAELGFELGDNALAEAFARFKALADRKKEIFEEDLIALVEDEIGHDDDRVKLAGLTVQAGSHGPQIAELTLEVDGARTRVRTQGQGPIDAVFRAIREAFPHSARLQLYQVHAVTGGIDAQAEVTVRLEQDRRSFNGQGTDIDTLVASARAYIHALNKILDRQAAGRAAAGGDGLDTGSRAV